MVSIQVDMLILLISISVKQVMWLIVKANVIIMEKDVQLYNLFLLLVDLAGVTLHILELAMQMLVGKLMQGVLIP